MKYIASVSGGKDSVAMVGRLIEEGYPLDEIVFYDTGKEFKAIYNLINKLKSYWKSLGIKFTILYPKMSFEYKMFEKPVCKRGTKIIHKYGYSWCGGNCRWGTTDKTTSIDKYCKEKYGKNGFMQYIGIAIDESKRLEKEAKPYKTFPLVDWKMTEKDCLDYCYSKGYNWLEKTDDGTYIDLYSILKRVSCWCCRNKNLTELKNIYKYFKKTYWKWLKEIQFKLKEPMKIYKRRLPNSKILIKTFSVFDLEERFKTELLKEEV